MAEARSEEQKFDNLYAGFSLRQANSRKSSSKAAKVELIPEINVEQIKPEEFYDRFVAERRPCLLAGSLEEAKFGAWTNEYVSQKAGPQKVKVELRGSDKESFGRGKSETMTVQRFLKRLEEGDGSVYMTTQDLDTDSEGRPNVMSAPVTQLQGDFPMRPAVMGNLVPVNYNLWMGANKNKSDSGLHHDYHDNLYILLRGTKIFRLYSPDEAHRMYTRGNISVVHPNGRICYAGLPTEADGSEQGAWRSLAAEDRQRAAEEELEKAEAAVEAGEAGAKERLEKAERELDKALKEVLSAETEAGGEEEDGDEEDEEEDEEGVAALFGPGGEEEDEDEEDEEDEEEGGLSGEEEEDGEEGEKPRPKGMDAGAQEMMGVARTSAEPLSFSTVDTTLPPAELAAAFPLFPAAESVECEVKAGQMLYLPAGWFHQVFSFGDPEGNGHMAFNYWFHPPDAGAGHFEAPYKTEFWPRDWQARSFPQEARE